MYRVGIGWVWRCCYRDCLGNVFRAFNIFAHLIYRILPISMSCIRVRLLLSTSMPCMPLIIQQLSVPTQYTVCDALSRIECYPRTLWRFDSPSFRMAPLAELATNTNMVITLKSSWRGETLSSADSTPETVNGGIGSFRLLESVADTFMQFSMLSITVLLLGQIVQLYKTGPPGQHIPVANNTFSRGLGAG